MKINFTCPFCEEELEHDVNTEWEEGYLLIEGGVAVGDQCGKCGYHWQEEDVNVFVTLVASKYNDSED